MEVGTVIHLQGITLRGKNRINRGGITWIVHSIRSNPDEMFVQSLKKGNREMFWMLEKGDPNVKRINGDDERDG